jgi:hypothetical protein
MAFTNQGYNAPRATTKTQRAEAYAKWNEKSAIDKVERSGVTDEGAAQFGTVSSSWIAAMGYDKEKNEAIVEFKDGFVAHYRMLWETFLEWRSAPSKGKWLHNHLEYMVGSGYIRKGLQNKAKKYRHKNARIREYLKKYR